MREFKRLLSLCLCLTLLSGLLCCASAVEAGATSACILDYETGRVLFEQNDREQRPIASITKIMTGYLACEADTDLDGELTCSGTAAAEGGSSFYLSKGEKLTFRDCIYGAMLPSGNDAAMLLAETIGGDKEGFARLMNKKAKELGMEDTHFGNPNGLIDEDNYSTAYDMCLLGRAAMRNELFAKVVRTKHYVSSRGKDVYGHIRIMDQDSRCIGIKTGWTSAAGKTLVSCFEDPDTQQRLIICTLNDWEQYGDHIRLADWAFERYPHRTLCEKGKVMSTLVNSATGETFYLKTAKGLYYPLSKSDTRQITVRLTLPSRTEALSAGDEAGTAEFRLKGRKLGKVKLVCVPDEEKNTKVFAQTAKKAEDAAQEVTEAVGEAAENAADTTLQAANDAAAVLDGDASGPEADGSAAVSAQQNENGENAAQSAQNAEKSGENAAPKA